MAQKQSMEMVKKEVEERRKNIHPAVSPTGADYQQMTPAQLVTWALYLGSVVGPLPERPHQLPLGLDRASPTEPPAPEQTPQTGAPTAGAPFRQHAGNTTSEPAPGGGYLSALAAWAREPLPGGWDPVPLFSGAEAGVIPPSNTANIKFGPPEDPPDFLARPAHAKYERAMVSPVYSSLNDQTETLEGTPWDTVEKFQHHFRTLHPKICKVNWRGTPADITRLRIKCNTPRTEDGRFLNYAHVRITFKDDRRDLEAIMPADGGWHNATSIFPERHLHGHWKRTSGVTVSLLEKSHVDDTHWGTRFTIPPLAPAVPIRETGLTISGQEEIVQNLPSHSPAEYSVYEEHYLPFNMSTGYYEVVADPENGWTHLANTPGLRFVHPTGSIFGAIITYMKLKGEDYQILCWQISRRMTTMRS
ncbi:hypothetical protein [Streptomyces sp. H27-D2]|uniref:hypothetical protein n=1 Tax=Streptomyces sp. H27-D2 TaxID=3046304 RepID=UPI002DBC20AC|nr:hypothetical protein [Streptomyces sp. H27-D2]MEC4017969.1 hypothetical protein [Streptomyces sp. H27-D2]